MKAAVIQFPGSNCDQDALWSMRNDVGIGAEYVWHEDSSLAGFGAVFVPGGFSYGDYLRCGAMASESPIMQAVKEFANSGGPVIGVCNGFQILCEAGLLPGALLLNEAQKFVCQDVYLEAVNRSSMWTAGVDRAIRIPVAHGEGRYICDADALAKLEANGQVAFRYVDGGNPNGSVDDIAGVVNKAGNVLGMMPHPERASSKIMGCEDGLLILKALSVVHSS